MRQPCFYDAACADMVVITGIPRSGTTILGKLVGSFQDFEYAFEPQIVYSLMGALTEDRMPADVVCGILRAYFAEDLMIDAHLGRRVNIRKQDWSYILNVKSEDELNAHIALENAQAALDDILNRKTRLAVKLISAWDLLDTFPEHFPSCRIVEIRRDLYEVVRSLMDRKWFAAETLRDHPASMLRMDSDRAAGRSVSTFHYADPGKELFWETAAESSRAADYVTRMAARSLEFRKKMSGWASYLSIRYDELTGAPEDTVRKIAQHCGARPSRKTDELLRGIRRPAPDTDVNDLLKNCDPDCRKALDHIARQWV